MTTFAVCVTIAATLTTLWLNRATAYYNRATLRHIKRLPAEPKPWFVRLYDKTFSRF